MNHNCECEHPPAEHFNHVGPCEHFTDPTYCPCPFYTFQGDD
jgi:hypothetical protein